MRPNHAPGFRHQLARTVAGVAAFLAVASAAGASHACNDQAMKRLGEIGVASTAITAILIETRCRRVNPGCPTER